MIESSYLKAVGDDVGDFDGMDAAQPVINDKVSWEVSNQVDVGLERVQIQFEDIVIAIADVVDDETNH